MSIGSVNTNIGAMFALQALESTATALQATQKQISTGYRVSDAVDNGASYSVAQSIRSSIGALTSANASLGDSQGLLSTALTGLNSASNELITMRSLLVSLAAGTPGSDAQTANATAFHSDLAQLKTFFQEAKYQGRNLISNFGGSCTGFVSYGAVVNEYGTTYHIGYYNASTVYNALSTGGLTSATAAAAFITATGGFSTAIASIGLWLTDVGNQVSYINNQISYNSSKIDALNAGLGSLVDADLAAESAQLTALQIRQQLAEQALSMANNTPAMLLSLFR